MDGGIFRVVCAVVTILFLGIVFLRRKNDAEE